MDSWSLKGKRIFFVGIKGTGMCALAELFQKQGAFVAGVDGSEHFYTDDILKELGIVFYEGLDTVHIDESFHEVIYSAAYNEENSADLAYAKKLNLPCRLYSQALGLLSTLQPSAAISGVHGKTTTTALCGSLVKSMGLSGSVLIGSAASDLKNRCTFTGGGDFFIAETCEYRRHFLSFSPFYMILTGVEEDHPDYFKDYQDIRSAFVELALKLPPEGALIFCSDDPGAVETAEIVKEARPSLRLIPYGVKAAGPFQIRLCQEGKGLNRFRLGFSGERVWQLKVPGHHFVLNATAALALISLILEGEGESFNENWQQKAAAGLLNFGGCRRRTEWIGEAGGVTFMDDYAHHPTAIKTTLEGYKAFYQPKRLVVDFMSHTYSRTQRLLGEFGEAFGAADIVVLNKIYASAREQRGEVTGQSLFEEVKKHHSQVYYCEEFKEAVEFLKRLLLPGDLFVTMGAGNNNGIGTELLTFFQEKEGKE